MPRIVKLNGFLNLSDVTINLSSIIKIDWSVLKDCHCMIRITLDTKPSEILVPHETHDAQMLIELFEPKITSISDLNPPKVKSKVKPKSDPLPKMIGVNNGKNDDDIPF